MPLNWADYCIIATLGLSVLMGLWRGFIGEVLALACWVLAFWVAWMFGDRLAEQFSGSIAQPSARLLLGYAICFFTILIAGAIVGFLMRKLIQGSGLSGSDRLLGMLFGLVRGVALVTLAVLMFGFTPFPRESWWQRSQLLPSFRESAQWLSARLPAEVNKYLDWRNVVPAPAQAPKPAPGAASPNKKSSTT